MSLNFCNRFKSYCLRHMFWATTAVLPKKQPSLCYATVIHMKVIPAAPVTAKTYQRKNQDLKRVLSPHLSIYKSQITSVMSISLRITGFALGILAWTVALTELLSGHCVDDFIEALKKLELDDCYWTAAKTVLAFPFAFHFVSGVRHLLFDTAQLLEKRQFYATGYAAFAVAIVLALCLGMIEDIRNKLSELRQQEQHAGTKKK